jgi:arylsulfatase
MAILEYEPGAAFPGVIGRTAEESAPARPAPVRARDGAPNVVFIVLDDTGFGQLGCYGSPIETPSFDALVANGLRYSNMHTTALCSPSRSCIITGRNHHSNAMAAITELASGYPGYNGVIPFENGFLSEMLGEHGYSTFLVGKYHLTPSNQETGAGPFDPWPLGRGFQRFYGFLGGDTSQWYPDLVYDNHQVEPPHRPEEGYHLSEDLVDKAMEFISDVKQVDPAKPFYLYLGFGATHAPHHAPHHALHHAPKEWADWYAGVFDDGWDAYRERVFARQKELGIVPADAELSRHDPDVPDCESLPPRARRPVQPVHGGVRRFPQPHRSPGRAAGRVPARARAAGQHADHGHLRQRRQRRGRAHRDHQRGAACTSPANSDPTSLATPQGGGSAATLRCAAPGAAALTVSPVLRDEGSHLPARQWS